MSWSSWSARVALQLSGRYEPYRLICRWLNVKRPGRCNSFRIARDGFCEQPLCIKPDRLYTAGYQIRKPFRFSSDNRPEAFAASFQNKNGRKALIYFPMFQHTAFYFPPAAGWRNDNGLSFLTANP